MGIGYSLAHLTAVKRNMKRHFQPLHHLVLLVLLPLLLSPLCVTSFVSPLSSMPHVSLLSSSSRVPSSPFLLRSSSLPSSSSLFDYDVAIVGCGVGGHAAALHARAQNLRVVVFSGGDVGGTCVNRGCVPSKALLAASGRVRALRDAPHLAGFGISVDGTVQYERTGIAGHAKTLTAKVKGNLEASLRAAGVEIVEDRARLSGLNTLVTTSGGKTVTAQDIILAPGSVPFVPKGIVTDGITVYTSDEALRLDVVPQWVAIVGSGYIGLEFSDIYTALGSEVTFVEAMPNLMPTFDREIAKLAERLLIKPRAIDYRVGVFASSVTPGIPGERPCVVKLTDAATGLHVETLEVDAVMVATGRVPSTADLGLETVGVSTKSSRGFVQVDSSMRVLASSSSESAATGSSPPAVVPNLYCIGDANGRMMLAHAAAAQGVSAVENARGRRHEVDHNAIPAACFTHPEIAMVGLTEELAVERAKTEGWKLGKSQGSFRANSKALAEGEGNGIAKVLFNEETGKLVGVHIIGMHAADLIQECANAIAAGTTVKQLAMTVHTHPTLCEVLDEAFKGAVGMSAH